jgi:hypothetical protein
MSGDVDAECGGKDQTKAQATRKAARQPLVGLLPISEFLGAVREEDTPEERGVTLCKFPPPSQEESAEDQLVYDPEGGGFDELIVSPRSVYLRKGKPQNLLEGPLQKTFEAAGETFTHLHGIGTRAELGDSGGYYAGLVQVRNDLFKVEKTDGSVVGMRGALSRAANELAPGGK